MDSKIDVKLVKCCKCNATVSVYIVNVIGNSYYCSDCIGETDYSE